MDIKAELTKPPVLIIGAGIGAALLVVVVHRSSQTQASALNTYPAIQSAGGLPGDAVPAPSDPNMTYAGTIDPSTGAPVWAEGLISAIQGLTTSNGPGSTTGQPTTPTTTTTTTGGSSSTQSQPTGLDFNQWIQLGTAQKTAQEMEDWLLTGYQLSGEYNPGGGIWGWNFKNELDSVWNQFNYQGYNGGSSTEQIDWSNPDMQNWLDRVRTEFAPQFEINNPNANATPVGSTVTTPTTVIADPSKAGKSWIIGKQAGGGGFVSSFRKSKKQLRAMGDMMAYQQAQLSQGMTLDLTG